jgi:hypothetical protein
MLEHLHYYDLRKGFEVCGIFTYLFVSINRNARGLMYVFLRYVKVHDDKKLSKALNNVYFDHLRVWENAERFEKLCISFR